jgi:membrane fusion protein, multidrug efflux system
MIPNEPIRRRAWPCALMLAMAVVLGAGCEEPAKKQMPPPPQVTVSRPLVRDVVQWDQFSAYLSSPQMASVKARVSGLIMAAPFTEGALVHKDDVLFKIDPRPFQADLDSKKAAVAQAKAMMDQANVHLARYTKVVGTQAISQDDYDAAKAAYEEASAAMSAAQAAMETTQLNLEWTEVRAPISGRIGKMNVTVGNLINGGSGQDTTLLTTIVSINPMYCYINVPESSALRYQKLALKEKQSSVAGAKIPCFLELQGATEFSHQGVIDFVDNQVDINTGTVQIRGVFANPSGLLTPGLFALMRIPASGQYQALLIPDAAVNTDQNERYLLIVGADNTVARRPIKLGALFGMLRSIESGLKPGEQVIVNGMQLARPGAKVEPTEAPIPTASLDELEKTGQGAAMTQPAASSQPASGTQSQPSAEGHP